MVFKRLSGGHLAWFILLYSVINAAMIPPWIMSIKANKLLRIAWRFLLQTCIMIPFVLYERRSGDASVKAKYSFNHIFQKQNFKKVYMSSFATSLWFTIILTCFEWTYISHAMVFGSLSNFCLSIMRAISGKQVNHELEKGGQVMVIIGLIMVLQDAYFLVPSEEPSYVYHVINPFYLGRKDYVRVIANLVAFGVSFILANISKYTANLREYYPPYLSMILINICICINMTFSAYFFNGATYDLDSFYGVFAIFSELHFAGFMYMSILLGLGLFISFVMITKLFSDPIAPALGMLFQPIISTVLLNLVGVQTFPGALACIGYVFVIPGLFLILMGQYVLRKGKEEETRALKEKETHKLEINKLETKVRELEMVVLPTSRGELGESPVPVSHINTNSKP